MRGSGATRVLGSRVRIPPGAWISVCYECCVLSGRGLCDELITSPEESYRMWCVWVWSKTTITICTYNGQTQEGRKKERKKKERNPTAFRKKLIDKNHQAQQYKLCNTVLLQIRYMFYFYLFFYFVVLWPTNAQLFHKLSHCYMFRHYRVILRQLAINTLPSYTSISNAAVGNTVYS